MNHFSKNRKEPSTGRKLSIIRPFEILTSIRIYIAFMMITLALGFLMTYWLGKSKDADMRSEALIQAKMVAAGIDLNLMKNLQGLPSDENSPQYQALKNQLKTFCAANPMCRFIYITGIHDDGSVFFFLDSEPAGSAESSPPDRSIKK